MEIYMRKIPYWLEAYTEAESLDILCDLAESHALQAGGQEGQSLAREIRRGNFRHVCDYETPTDIPVGRYLHLRQAQALLSKVEFLPLGIDTEKAAYEKFLESEVLCRETNTLFRGYERGNLSFDSRVEQVLYLAQRKIAHVLGSVPPIEKWGLRFGPGATTLTKKREASLREKFRAGISCSEECLPSAARLLAELPHLAFASADSFMADEDEWWASVPVVIHDATLSFVPKTAKTKRIVFPEPVLNGLGQMALGDVISRRLAAVGVDIRDQTRNQFLAREGSLTGALATLDLQSASDTISRELVAHLLPLDWWNALKQLRTGHVRYRGERITLEKFSGMGNGFTFPLETLIFWSLARAVCVGDREVVSVYGDDIIVPTHRYEELVHVLRVCGFLVNQKKSFHKGPFRESCGADWISGIDVRPYYQKDLVTPQGLFVLHNFYVRHGDHGGAEKVRKLIHPSLQIFGPEGYGDGHLVHFNDGLVVPVYLKKPSHSARGWAGITFRSFKEVGLRDERGPLPTDFVLPLYTVYRRDAGESGLEKSILGSAIDPIQPGLLAFKQRFKRGHGSLSGPDPLPEVDGTKSASLPGVSGYKKVSIYTLTA
jgi:hypothetical protein